jgi:hypothetical protein
VLTALMLICSIAETPDLADCTYRNAATLMRVPAEFASPTTCFMQAQAYLASTPTGRELTPDERVKIVCVRSEILSASVHHR